MAWQRWYLMLAASAVLAVVASGSEHTADDAGICNSLIQYVVGDGKRAIDGSTVAYCAGEKDCHRTLTKVCCNGWRRDLNSKKLRCVKIDPAERVNSGIVVFGTDQDHDEDNISVRKVRNTAEKEASPQENVTPPRGSQSPSGNAPAESSSVNTDQSRANIPSTGVPGTPSGSQQTSEKPSQKETASGPHDPSTNTKSSTSKSNATVADQRGSASGSAKGKPIQGPEPAAQSASEDGKVEPEAVHSNQPNPPARLLASGTVPSSANGTPNLATSTPPDAGNSNTAHTIAKQDVPSPRSSADGSAANQEPLKNGPTPASGQSTNTGGQAQSPPPVPDLPPAIHPGSNNNASNDSAIGHTGVESQAPATEKHIDHDQHGDSIAMGGSVGPGNGPVTTASTVTIKAANTPVASTSLAAAAATSNVQTEGKHITTPASTPGPTSGTAASPAVTPAGQSKKPEQGSNIAVVSPPTHSEQNINSTQDTGPLSLTPPELNYGRREDTIPLNGIHQSSTAPLIPTTTTTTNASTTTKAPITAATTAHSTGPATAQPHVANSAEAAENVTSHNSVHTGFPSPLGNNTTTSATATAPTQSTSHGGTPPTSVANPTSVPAPQHSKINANNDTPEYKVFVTSKNTAQRSSDGKSSVGPGQPGGSNAANATEKNDTATFVGSCTRVGSEWHCITINSTTVTIPPRTSTVAPVAKLLGDKQPTTSTAVPSSSSASKTASEVTISLLLVAAVAFVAALLYWRSRRRRRRYMNCGTREPNLNFSNPVYDLEAMMEQTSLVKLQNAADTEDGNSDDVDHEATSQRK